MGLEMGCFSIIQVPLCCKCPTNQVGEHSKLNVCLAFLKRKQIFSWLHFLMFLTSSVHSFVTLDNDRNSMRTELPCAAKPYYTIIVCNFLFHFKFILVFAGAIYIGTGWRINHFHFAIQGVKPSRLVRSRDWLMLYSFRKVGRKRRMSRV